MNRETFLQELRYRAENVIDRFIEDNAELPDDEYAVLRDVCRSRMRIIRTAIQDLCEDLDSRVVTDKEYSERIASVKAAIFSIPSADLAEAFRSMLHRVLRDMKEWSSVSEFD